MILKRPRRTSAAAALLLAVHAGLLAWSATRHSPSIDEVGHIAAGLSHWQFGRFDLYRVNPPLVRLAATALVALLRPQTDWQGYSLLPGARSEFECGEQFIAANGQRSFWLFTVARWACIPFSLLGGYVCYRWAGELYGAGGGLLTLSLWCFCPNILAHGQMITPDVGATALGAAAGYLFWRWLREPSWPQAFLTGVALGLAELTKATFVVLYAVWPLAWLIWRYTGGGVGQAFQPDDHEAASDGRPTGQGEMRRQSQTRQAGKPDLRQRQAGKPDLRQAGQLALMAVLSLYVLNLGYAFEGSLQPLGQFQFISEALGGPRDMARPDSRRNRFAETALAGFRVPLPANYLLGIDSQKFDFEVGYNSYLRGEWRHGGWWYYYLYGLAIKVPLGTWALIAMALVRLALPAMRRGQPEVGGQCPPYQPTWRDEFVLLLPAVTILALVSSQTGFNHHLRYVLPIFPFVFIWIGRLGRLFGVRRFIAAFPCREATFLQGCDAAAVEKGGSAAIESGDKSPHSMAKCTIALALAWSIGSSLWYYPHSLSYFNELVGGPLGGRWHLLDSNIDWGQDLLYLKSWLDEHPEARLLGLAYFGYIDPRIAGIEFSLPPQGPVADAGTNDSKAGDKDERARVRAAPDDELGPRPGWYAVSLMMLHGYKYPIPDGRGKKLFVDRPYFTYFQRFEPVARAGYSIYIYHLEPAEVDRVRRELGLPPLAQPEGEV